MTMFTRDMLVRFGVAALCVMVAGTAQADCGQVIAAFKKADATGRFAWYELTDGNQAVTGDPIMVSIGDVSYVPVGGGSRYKGKYQSTGLLKGVLGAKLTRDEHDGTGKCTPLADRTVRGEPAIGFNVTGGVPISKGDPASEDVWISRATGLPIIQGMDSAGHGGVVWVYGPAVSAPTPDKLL